MEYCFHFHNTMSKEGLARVLRRMLPSDQPPVVLCIGSDLVTGDSLGPLTGTMLQKKTRGVYLYGTLRTPITAKESDYLNAYIKLTHPNATVIAIDAAVGERSEQGLVKITDTPLRPGAGAHKKLQEVGSISILGIVSEKTAFTITKLNYTRLNMVYHMAELISDAIASYLSNKHMFVLNAYAFAKNEQFIQKTM